MLVGCCALGGIISVGTRAQTRIQRGSVARMQTLLHDWVGASLALFPWLGNAV